MSSALSWVPLRVEDVSDVVRIADQLHPGLPERPEVYGEKIRLAPETCRKLVRHGVCLGYGIAHPWRLNAIPPLDTLLDELPTDPDCLYLHDVALLPSARGQSAPATYVQFAIECARQSGLPRLAMTSVYGSDVVWRRFGFEVVPATPDLASKLAGYGPSAKYMVLSVS